MKFWTNSGCILAESDNESTSNTPVKFNNARFSNIGVKTLEEIRLEKIQEASAALYFYGNQNCLEQEDLLNNDEQDLRQRLRSTRLSQKKDSDFEILTLTEIRKRKSSDNRNVPKVNVLEKVQNVLLQAKNELEKNNATNITTTPEIKIKTLDEIRAERALKNKTQDDEKPQNRVKRSLSTDLRDSSNCKRLKIQRKKSISCVSITDCNSNNNFVQIPVSEKSVDQRLVNNESTVCDTDNLSESKMITVPNLMCDIQDEEPHKQIDSYNDDVTMDDIHISDEKQRHENTDSNDILQDIDQLLNEND